MGGTYPEQYGSDPAARLMAEVAHIRALAEAGARPRALIIPVVDADPSAEDPTNIWGFDDGRLRWRGTDGVVHEILPRFPLLSLSANPSAASGIDIYRHASSDELRVRRADGTWARYAAIAPASSSSSNDPGGSTTKPRQANTSPHTHRQTYAASWGRTMCPVHGAETGGESSYGRWSSTHGRRRVMIGFNDAAIRADLAGADIRKVELSMRNTHAYLNSGITVRWGGHNKSSPPSAYSAVRRNVWSGHWPKNGTGATWRGGKGDILWFGRALRDNTIKGLVVDQLTDSVTFYGALDWSSVRLRITYSHKH